MVKSSIHGIHCKLKIVIPAVYLYSTLFQSIYLFSVASAYFGFQFSVYSKIFDSSMQYIHWGSAVFSASKLITNRAHAQPHLHAARPRSNKARATRAASYTQTHRRPQESNALKCLYFTIIIMIIAFL